MASLLGMESGGHSLVFEMPKYKSRRVSALRDFPPGCGPNAPKADFGGNGAVCYGENAQSAEHSDGGYLETENKETLFPADSPGPLQGADKSVDLVLKAAELELISEQLGVEESVHVALQAIENELMKDEHSFDGLVDLSKRLGSNDMSGELLPGSYHSSPTLQVNAEYITKQFLQETQEQSNDLTENKLKISTVLRNDGKKISADVCNEINYPPRRRVSAIRDFPPGCGTNIMAELQSSICIPRENLNVAYDRKMEKGASEVRDGKEAVLYRKDKEDKKRKNMHTGLATSSCIGAKNSRRENGIVGKKLKFKMKPYYIGAKDRRREIGVVGKQVKFKVKPFLIETKKDTEVTEQLKKCFDPDEPPRRDARNSFENDRRQKDLPLHVRSREVDASLPVKTASCTADGIARNKVRETLRLFQVLTRVFLQEEESHRRNIRRVDLLASTALKEAGKYSNAGKQITGHVPGVEVGDEFHYRVELMIIGLHRPPQGGIDYVKEGDTTYATSVVDSGGYDNKVDNYDVWTYTGQGGNVTSRNKVAADQKLERGNLALKNSMQAKREVRIIRGVRDTKPCEGRPKVSMTYTYYGLYTVERYWQEIGQYGKKEYKFELKRISGQRELPWKEVKRSKKLNLREGLCVSDISQGREKFPIGAVNTIDFERPPPFKYISRMVYPAGHPLRPRGCDCKNGCLSSTECSCVVKNGGSIPYNYDGAIVEAKPVVYECGPSCKCPPSCYNRVSQHGVKFQLEIFKTERRGWGVRSLSSIPSGSFICEYTGELLEDKEAEQRTDNDEYLFDIGQNRNDHSIWDGLSGLIPNVASNSHEVVSDSGFTIDAAKYGNVGRFINHSCSPNLYAQNVLYDHGDTRMPHIMLFAAENIPPLQELTYHYNYKLGQVYDKDGNVKSKYCHCGSSNCSGRMY